MWIIFCSLAWPPWQKWLGQPAGTKDWSGFLKRMDAYNAHIAEKGIVYARSMYNIQQTVTPVDGHLEDEFGMYPPGCGDSLYTERE